jgi:hypothetical protein
MTFHEPPQWKLKTYGHTITRASCHSPKHGQVDKYNIQAPIRNKNN